MEENIPKQENNQKAGSSEKKSDLKGFIAQLEAILDEYMIKKAPFAIPLEAKEFIVSVSPYLIIISAIFVLPVILLAFSVMTGATLFMAPFAMMGAYSTGFAWGIGSIISLITAVAAFILDIKAVPGLFKREKKAWKLVFYASIVSLIGGIFSMHGIFGTIIGAIIGWYIIFQVKDMYKN